MTSESTPAIEVSNLTKHYGEVLAVNDISFSVSKGELFGFLGPNGAGKTTLLKILATIMNPTAGKLMVFGQDVKDEPEATRRRIGVVSHQSFFYSSLTIYENLEFYARMYGIVNHDKRIREVIAMVGMTSRLQDRTHTLSRGMQQRISIARALLHRPEIVLLDEPETGLDQQALAMLWQVIQQDSAGRRTILMTSHNLERGLEVADRLVIMARGRLVHDCAARNITAGTLRDTYLQCTGASL